LSGEKSADGGLAGAHEAGEAGHLNANLRPAQRRWLGHDP
jgi:hypothetical protein